MKILNPVLTIVRFAAEDVIATSGGVHSRGEDYPYSLSCPVAENADARHACVYGFSGDDVFAYYFSANGWEGDGYLDAPIINPVMNHYYVQNGEGTWVACGSGQ